MMLVRIIATVAVLIGAQARAEQLPPIEYRELVSAYTQYARIAGDGGWPALPHGLFLKRGAAIGVAPETLAVLCRRLAITGDLRDAPRRGLCEEYRAPTASYDARLEEAIKAFQTRHGLVVDGIVGRRTVRALNVSAAQRLDQLALNLRRWESIAHRLGDVYVRVNIPAFRLEAVEHGETMLSMPVVVGRARTPTPVFSDAITYLVFRPYWNVPDSITRDELLPKALADPRYLERQRFEVVDGWRSPARVIPAASIDWTADPVSFPYRLRQRPGAGNALGVVKFMFPNRHNVYLHDTPAKHLFNAAHRAFSHGCVRVADPVALAEWLLRDRPEWPREAIAQAMDGGARQVVKLDAPIPVHLTYFTAWVDGGAVHFARDIYRRDQSGAAT